MRKGLILIISAIHLLGNTELGELLKLPRLVAHYVQHHSNDSSVGFFDFINMHYVNGDDGTTKDDRQDEQLPCHNIKQQHSFSQTLTHVLRFQEIHINQPFPSNIFGNKPQADFSTDFASLIFQPPRV